MNMNYFLPFKSWSQKFSLILSKCVEKHCITGQKKYPLKQIYVSPQALVKASKEKKKSITVPQNTKNSDNVPNLVLHKSEVLEIDEINSKYDSDDQRIVKLLMARCKVNMRNVSVFVQVLIFLDDKGRHRRRAWQFSSSQSEWRASQGRLFKRIRSNLY